MNQIILEQLRKLKESNEYTTHVAVDSINTTILEHRSTKGITFAITIQRNIHTENFTTEYYSIN